MLEEIYLIRHAAPDRGARIPYNLPPGPPLTPDGQREAAQAAARLEGRGIELLLTSPFLRTTATAEVIAARLHLEARPVEALREGAPGETLDQIQARVAELLHQVDDGPHGCVALVTHGACVRGVLLHTTSGRIDLGGHVYDSGNNTPTAGIWHGRIVERRWHWELAFRPNLALAPAPGSPAPVDTPPPAGGRVEWI
jgi:broad specificity phosphatase PhoE